MNTIPKEITVIKAVHYDINELIQIIKEERSSDTEPTYDEVIEVIKAMAKDEFSCGWGHKADLSGVSFYDQDGNEIL